MQIDITLIQDLTLYPWDIVYRIINYLPDTYGVKLCHLPRESLIGQLESCLLGRL